MHTRRRAGLFIHAAYSHADVTRTNFRARPDLPPAAPAFHVTYVRLLFAMAIAIPKPRPLLAAVANLLLRASLIT